jgi:hypothetical protein
VHHLPAARKGLEVDPRGQPELAFGIGERARRISEGVLTAIGMHQAVSTRNKLRTPFEAALLREGQP